MNRFILIETCDSKNRNHIIKLENISRASLNEKNGKYNLELSINGEIFKSDKELDLDQNKDQFLIDLIKVLENSDDINFLSLSEIQERILDNFRKF